ncbi:MAG: helix-hairpin-helix domain-containing protein [Bacteroidaceae bacterium]|nr:helix-hairpin-helix domain-containing protein [Candidatus Colenecus caballi]MCQ2073138.1 helix-hairpin-helix domain-containing protein [Bacteroidaceae bacterium]
MSKDIFYFSKSDRVAALILLCIIAVLVSVRCGFEPEKPVLSADLQDSLKWEPAPRVYRYHVTDTVVHIVHKVEYVHTAVKRYERVDSLKPKTKKIPISPIDLNRADSSDLVKLPGIGAYFASRIVRYREQLGGFVSTAQLFEIDGLADSVAGWFFVSDSLHTVRLDVNALSLSSLRRHPYLNFYQARAIVEFRKDRGKLKGPEQLALLEEFTQQDLERLEPYLDFK